MKVNATSSSNNWRGFTIVELLIVIVVIAILAAITIVAYNGIQARANDSSIQSDISNLIKKIKLYEAEFGTFPPSGYRSGDSTIFPAIGTFKPTKSAYSQDVDNLFYCEGSKPGIGRTWAVAAQSKTGKVFYYRSEEGSVKVVSSGDAWGHCQTGWDTSVAPTHTAYSYGYFGTTKTWYAWTN